MKQHISFFCLIVFAAGFFCPTPLILAAKKKDQRPIKGDPLMDGVITHKEFVYPENGDPQTRVVYEYEWSKDFQSVKKITRMDQKDSEVWVRYEKVGDKFLPKEEVTRYDFESRKFREKAEYFYNNQSWLVKKVWQSEEAEGIRSVINSFTYDEVGRISLSETEEIWRDTKAKVVSEYEYDKEGNLIKEFSGGRQGKGTPYLYSYSQNALVKTRIKYHEFEDENDKMQKTIYETLVETFDDQQNLVDSKKYDGDAKNKKPVEEFSFAYDDQGRLIRKTHKRAGRHPLPEMTHEYYYDKAGRLGKIKTRTLLTFEGGEEKSSGITVYEYAE